MVPTSSRNGLGDVYRNKVKVGLVQVGETVKTLTNEGAIGNESREEGQFEGHRALKVTE